MANADKKNLRYNILTIMIYTIGIILLLQLFRLQIVYGEEYYTRSSRRLTRETTISAARGHILDRDGNIIAGTTPRYSVQIFRSRVENDILNSTILKVINILEESGDRHRDLFPVSMDGLEFTRQGERLENWKNANDIDENFTPEEVVEEFKKRYEIMDQDIEDARKIIAVRYGIAREGFSSMRPYVIANNVSMQSVAQIEEQASRLPGVSIETRAIRTYYMGSLASHIIGYAGPISEEELRQNPDYSMHDYIGKTGIELVFERFLRGEDGRKQTDMSAQGTLTGEYITSSATVGHDVVLTIDANLQRAAEIAIRNNIEKIRAGGFGRAFNAIAGTVVVLDIRTGEVLAMVSYPDFEPELFIEGISIEKWNEYNDPERKNLLNRSVQSAYAPGSIYKMVPAIAALQEGYVTIHERIFCGGVFARGHNPRCWVYPYGHGWVDVSQAIKYSCNIFFYEVGSRMGIDILEEYSVRFGLGRRTNIELPGELRRNFSRKGII